MSRISVLVLPVFRRHWLFHAWQTERQALKSQFTSINLLKWAAVPKDLEQLRIIYPSSWRDTLVRRRLRLLIKQRRAKHRSRLLTWSLASVPLTLLLVTPLPAIPVYYTYYRTFSHYKALAGCDAIRRALAHQDAEQLQDLRQKMLQMQINETDMHPLGWPAKLIKTPPKYLDILDTVASDVHVEARSQMAYAGTSEEQLVRPELQPSEELDAIVKPAERLHSPLEDEQIIEIDKAFSVGGLMAHAAAARKRVLGAAFPKRRPSEST
eukprot:jgi/Astpho2/9144/fgenesh1_pg.00135_%23_8_t